MLLRLGKNSMGSNSVSQWKMFQFFNVVLQTGPCPALAPRTTHTHMSTPAQAQCSASHPPLLGAGDGCNLCPTPAEQKRGGSAADTQPEASLPVWEQNACLPWPHSQPQRLGGPQRKEIGLQTFLVSVHLHVKQFSHTMEGVVCNIPSSLCQYEMAMNTALSLSLTAWPVWS